jgi:hypothetical protein
MKTTLTQEDIAALVFIRRARANRLAGMAYGSANQWHAIVSQVAREQRAMARP